MVWKCKKLIDSACHLSRDKREVGVVYASSRVPSKAGKQGFTLVELLVVIAIISILAALLLPALSKAKGRAQSMSCNNNVGQLAMAMVLYADNNNSRYPLNLRSSIGSMVGSTLSGSWVNGSQNGQNPLQMTSTAYLYTLPQGSAPLLGEYVASAKVYKCPADFRTATYQGQVLPAARSYAMNGFVGAVAGDQYDLAGYMICRKEGDVQDASTLLTFLDEAGFSIDDGFYGFCDNGGPVSGNYAEYPATYHVGSSALSFADGHAETHKWKDAYSVSAALTAPPVPSVAPSASADWQFMAAHAAGNALISSQGYVPTAVQ